MGAREELAAVQQRADLASGGYSWPRRAGKTAAMEVLADNARMHAALTAALDAVDRIDAIEDEMAHRPTIVRHLRAVITDALTPKEADS